MSPLINLGVSLSEWQMNSSDIGVQESKPVEVWYASQLYQRLVWIFPR
jgi:hypothetical protein